MVPPLEANTTLRAPHERAPSSTRSEPITLTSASKMGSATDTRTSAWAARWKTTSGRHRFMSSARSGERMSSWWKVRCPSRGAGPRPDWRATRSSGCRPRRRRGPAASSRSTRVEPMKPAPPGDEGLHVGRLLLMGQPATGRPTGGIRAGPPCASPTTDRSVTTAPASMPRPSAHDGRPHLGARPDRHAVENSTDPSTTAPAPTVTSRPEHAGDDRAPGPVTVPPPPLSPTSAA